MSIAAWLKRTFRPHSRFDPSVGAQRMPSCTVRQYLRTDLDACRELYSLNEPGRFPPGYQHLFIQSLESPLYRFLVIESAGHVASVGGICRSPDVRAGCSLVFGMVHPARHRQGLGTVMLLARLAALPRPTNRCWAFLASAGESSTFYERFGFQYYGRYSLPPGNRPFDCYRCYLEEAEWEGCGRALEKRNAYFDREGIDVPLGPGNTNYSLSTVRR